MKTTKKQSTRTKKAATRLATVAPFEIPARIVLSQSNATAAQGEKALARIREYIDNYGLLPDAWGNDSNAIGEIATIMRPKQVAAAKAALDATDKFLNEHGAPNTCGGSDDATALLVEYTNAALLFGLTLGCAISLKGGVR